MSHVFKNNNVARGSQGFVRQRSRNVALRVEQPSVLNNFFQNYNTGILPRSGRAYFQAAPANFLLSRRVSIGVGAGGIGGGSVPPLSGLGG